MEWKLNFISEEDFTKHVQVTIEKYGKNLETFDIPNFNKNIVDPIKLIFDKTVYGSTWNEIVKNEIFRQQDKSKNNNIGYFHQRIFQYINNCIVPKTGWDIIYKNEDGITLPGGDKVHTIFVEMKNKHNTMNSTSSAKIYSKMQNQLLEDDDCACFLVEAIAKESQNIIWEISVDGNKKSHKRIRRVSIDQFYALVTGQDEAFFEMCMVLPKVIEKITNKGGVNKVTNEIVLDGLISIADNLKAQDEESSVTKVLNLLGFITYKGFNGLLNDEASVNDITLKRLYEYAKING